MQPPPGTHVFYHADRSATLKEGQRIELNEYNLSKFGMIYWPIINQKSVDEMEDSCKREYLLELVRQHPDYSLYTSRLQSIFAANSLTDAISFAKEISPRPLHPIPIIEIYANRFWNLDSNWLDFDNEVKQIENFHNYWNGRISNHRPEVGLRRPPRIEVMNYITCNCR
ncbi:hypothetical protein [Chitinophaga silvisoli]|uniref:DUF2441 domain-containing protein n=1 Tax=Chitinophaga silvisoli TaxID=2291814 RepID=A0A3E1P7B4_9BACT|nr:hypothetical protein [Chitinophaga silvisoli]RFM36037.1 hypothetical protein DXN04_00540 [Chitinophaga silvisoli]